MDIIDEINDDFYPNGRDYDSENEDWGLEYNFNEEVIFLTMVTEHFYYKSTYQSILVKIFISGLSSFLYKF